MRAKKPHFTSLIFPSILIFLSFLVFVPNLIAFATSNPSPQSKSTPPANQFSTSSTTSDFYPHDQTPPPPSNLFFYVTINEGTSSFRVKTKPSLIQELLSKLHINLHPGDKVEPGLEEKIDTDNFFINIYRAHPIVLIDGPRRHYLNLASFDQNSIAAAANLTLYDGDQIQPVKNNQLLEIGPAFIYQLIRHGGRTITVQQEITAPDEEIDDYNLAYGIRKITESGTIGTKELVYSVKFQHGQEKSRTLVSEKIITRPTPRTILIGRKISATTPLENEKITWTFLRKKGFSKVQTAGIMGNLMQEHRFSTSDGPGGLGIAQWIGGRRQNLLQKPNPYDIHTQLNYLLEELDGKEHLAKKALLSATTIEEATRAFQNKFERCGICREQVRIGFAYAFYERYKNAE